MAYIKGNDTSENLLGTSSGDLIEGFGGNDTIRGGAGADTISGGTSNDFLYGDDGNDRISGDAGNDHIYGGLGNDTLSGNDGDDTFYSGQTEGYDFITGGEGYDMLRVSPTGSSLYSVEIGYFSSMEEIYNTSASQSLSFKVSGFVDFTNVFMNSAGGGFGSINGSAGADNIYASNYLNDTVFGNGGNDHIHGGKGNDLIFGGAGADVFIFYADDGQDRVADYVDGTDKIRIYAPGEVSSIADIIITASGTGTQLDFAGTMVTLSNVAPSLIDASDFIFS